MNRAHIIKTAFMPLGRASVNVEYELIDGEAQVLNAFINGQWTDPQDWIAPSVFDGWQEELTRGHREDLARLHADGAAMLKRIQDGQGAWVLGDQSRKSRLTAESGEGGAWLAKGAWTLSSEQMRAVDDTAGIVGEAA